MIYIENISKNKVLETTNYLGGHLVILQDFEKDKAEQLWKKGETNAEGYFTLENSKVPKFITLRLSGLEIKGNSTLRAIVC